ncbi:MAG: (Fe-S)-binding protein, partial [Candidatus Thorarchaeota archaeon]
MTDSFSELKTEGLDDEPTICARCGYCSFVCPAYLDVRWDSQSPRGKLQQLKSLIKEGKPIPPDFAKRIFDCTLCGMCQQVCQTNIPLLRFWQAVRKEVGNLGLGPEIIDQLDQAIESTQNIMGMDQEDRSIWSDNVEDLVAGRFKKEADVGYFLGCNISFKGSLVKTAENTIRILNHLDTDFTILGDEELCCGNPYFVAGKGDKAKELAERNLSVFKRLGVRTILFNCPGCHRAFAQEYADLVDQELLEGMEFFTLSQFVSRMLKEG